MSRRLLTFAALALAAAACEDKRAILTNPSSTDAMGFQLVQGATNLPRGSARFVLKRTAADVTPESVTVTLQGLDSLGGGFYTMWVGDSLGATWKRAAGAISVSRRDSTVDAIGNVVALAPVTSQVGTASAFKNGGPRNTYTVAITRASAGLVAADSIQHFLISIEGSADATTPGSRRVLWARRGDGSAVPATGTAFRTTSLSFGNYAPVAANQYLYVAAPARGRGYFVGPSLLIADSSLARPPIGYFYALFALGPQFGTTTADTVYLGEQVSPWPRRNLSHFNADSVITDPLVVLDAPRSIIAGSLRAEGPELGLPSAYPFKDLQEVWLTLMPKDGIAGRLGTARVLRGTVPYLVFLGVR